MSLARQHCFLPETALSIHTVMRILHDSHPYTYISFPQAKPYNPLPSLTSGRVPTLYNPSHDSIP